MPKIIFKESTLNDAASIIKYNHRETFYLRIKRDGKKYSNISLQTTDIDTARKNALKSYMEHYDSPVKSRSTSKYKFLTACEKFLQHKEDEMIDEGIKKRSIDTYRQRIFQRIIPFAKTKGIDKIGDIEKDSFEDYRKYYLRVSVKGRWNTETKGLSASTINSDISTLCEFLKWMVKVDLLDARKCGFPPRVKDVKNKRDESNPAFFPEQFRVFKDSLYKMDQDCSDEIKKWKMRWFIHYVLFQYHLGSRPHETALIRVKDTKIETRKDGNVKGIVKIQKDTKRGERYAIMNGNTLRKVISHLKKGIKLRNQEIAAFNHRIETEFAELSTPKLCNRFKRVDPKTRRWKEHPEFSENMLLMLNPFRLKEDIEMFSVQTITDWYKEVLSNSGLDEPYTLYSLRSTHITHALLNGMNIRQVAENAGTSQSEIEATYQRLNNLLNIDKLGFHKSNQDEYMVMD